MSGWQRDEPHLAQEKGPTAPSLSSWSFILLCLNCVPQAPHPSSLLLASLMLLLALRKVLKVTKKGKYRQTPAWYKFSNMNWRKDFFVSACRLFQHRKQLVQKAHFAARVSAQSPSTDFSSSSSSCEEADLWNPG